MDYCSPPVGSSHRRRRVRGKEEERGRGREQAVIGRAAVTVEMQIGAWREDPAPLAYHMFEGIYTQIIIQCHSENQSFLILYAEY